MPAFRLPLALLLLSAAASALEIADPRPEWLDETWAPSWRSEPLVDCLTALGAAVERPVVLSDGLTVVPAAQVTAMGRLAGRARRPVVYVPHQRRPIETILRALERSQDLYLVAEPLRLVAMTAEEQRDRRRSVVDLHLRDYAQRAALPDLPGEVMGLPLDPGRGGGGFDLFGDAGAMLVAEAGAVDPDILVELLEQGGGGADVALRGGTMHLRATPEEAAAMVAQLEAEYALLTRRGLWRATFGWLPPEGELTLGLIEPARAAAIAAGLAEPRVLDLAALDGQLVSAADQERRDLVLDAEVAAYGGLDPVVETVVVGVQAELRMQRGTDFGLLELALDWVEAEDAATTTVTRPAAVEPGRLEVSASATPGAGDAGTSTETDATHTASGRRPGERLILDLPALWTWRPRLQLLVPQGRDLVLCARRGERTAVIVLQELRP